LNEARKTVALQKARASYGLKRSNETIQGYKNELSGEKSKLIMAYAKYQCEEK